jgi:hypothetical protein
VSSVRNYRLSGVAMPKEINVLPLEGQVPLLVSQSSTMPELQCPSAPRVEYYFELTD